MTDQPTITSSQRSYVDPFHPTRIEVLQEIADMNAEGFAARFALGEIIGEAIQAVTDGDAVWEVRGNYEGRWLTDQGKQKLAAATEEGMLDDSPSERNYKSKAEAYDLDYLEQFRADVARKKAILTEAEGRLEIAERQFAADKMVTGNASGIPTAVEKMLKPSTPFQDRMKRNMTDNSKPPSPDLFREACQEVDDLLSILSKDTRDKIKALFIRLSHDSYDRGYASAQENK